MAFVELNLDPFLTLQQNHSIPGIDPVIAAGIAEMAGVDRLGITSPEGESELPTRLFETVSTECNWRIPVSEKAVDSVMTSPPDMVTFIDPLKANHCLDLRGASDLGRIFAQVRTIKSVAVAVRIENDIKQVKNAYKLGADYIELNGTPFTNATSTQEQQQALESLTSLSRIADKYQMKVLISGGINYRNFHTLLEFGAVDTLVIGRAILGKALFIGLENAVRDFLFMVK